MYTHQLFFSFFYISELNYTKSGKPRCRNSFHMAKRQRRLCRDNPPPPPAEKSLNAVCKLLQPQPVGTNFKLPLPRAGRKIPVGGVGGWEGDRGLEGCTSAPPHCVGFVLLIRPHASRIQESKSSQPAPLIPHTAAAACDKLFTVLGRAGV